MKKMRIRNRRKHDFLVIKILLIISLFSFSFCFTIKYFVKNIDNESFLRLLIQSSNSHIERDNNPKIFTQLISFITDIDLKEPITLLKNNYVGKDFKTENNPSDEKLEVVPESNYIKDPYKKVEITDPIVYLYNSHQSEEYATNNLESYNVKPTVMMTSYILREKLNKNGISTIVEENDVTEFLRTNNWNYSSSYKVTKILMEDAYSKNQSLEFFVDLHRDSVKKNVSSITIGDKKYAKILFIVGLENKNYAKNLKMTETLNNKFNKKYPGLSRGVYKKQGSGVNGVYNQDFHPNTILIEVGGVDNTIDEVFNTCEAISEVLTEYIKEVKDEE